VSRIHPFTSGMWLFILGIWASDDTPINTIGSLLLSWLASINCLGFKTANPLFQPEGELRDIRDLRLVSRELTPKRIARHFAK
jgi:hypothetical protein